MLHGADKVSEPAPVSASPASSELRLRVISALVLAVAALVTTWAGGVAFLIFWALAACAIIYEWNRMAFGADSAPARVGYVAILAAVLGCFLKRFDLACVAVMLGAAGAALLAPAGKRLWGFFGPLYASAALLGAVVVRLDAKLGIIGILFLFAVVWATDIAAYFTGRALGGPKLWPAVSPKKTWSGAIGGAAAAVLAGVGIAALFTAGNLLPVALVALVLSAASQLGDLFESGMKRHFGIKDSSSLIPGHGGVMDRLDGFIFACALAALIGAWRTGPLMASSGVLAW